MATIADLWHTFWDVLKTPPWGEIALAAGVLTAIPALVGFAFWVAEQRRRPDVEFLWKLSTSGDVDDLAVWPPSYEPEVQPHSRLLIETSVRNVGDAATTHAMTNFVVPTSVKLAKVSGKGPPPTPTQVGGEPVHFIPAEFDLAPGTWRLQRFTLDVPDGPLGIRVRMTLSDDRLNASGQRWLPSRLVGLSDADTTAHGDPWPPPRPSVRRQWQRVRAQPHDRVWCVRGERADVRDITVVGVSAPTGENGG